jgi:hypothetical protein
MDRRRFLAHGAVALGGGVLAPTMAASRATAQTATPGESPYGSLDGIEPDENGIVLPEGFTSRIIGTAGEPVAGTDHLWHAYPDGAATFPDGEGGWYYTCNSEVFSFMAANSGGVSAVHFGSDGEILGAYPILSGSQSNCAGGPTPWGTWLSCEEEFDETGRVWECDPTGEQAAVVHEAMGRWAHEAAAVDPVGEQIYMTQDHPEGLLYRFTPDTYPDLSAGLLEAATVTGSDVTWTEVPDPLGSSVPTREQIPGATRFNGGEGIWYHDGFVYFTSKGDNSVHAIDLLDQAYSLIWRAGPDPDPNAAVLSGVDNITVSTATGDLYVAEDGGTMEVVILTPDGQVAPFCRVPGHEGSEITGPCFDPNGERLYFSSQRAPTPKAMNEIVPAMVAEDRFGGVTFEITGPFNGATPPALTTTLVPPTTPAPSAPPVTETAPADTPAPTDSAPSTEVPSPVTTLAKADPQQSGDGDDDGSGVAIGIGVAAAAAAAIGAVVFFVRRRSDAGDEALPAADGADDDEASAQ